MGVGSGMLATSNRCCTRRPEGPAAVSLGKDRKTERILKTGSRVRGAEWVAGATVGQLGYLDCNRCHVPSSCPPSEQQVTIMPVLFNTCSQTMGNFLCLTGTCNTKLIWFEELCSLYLHCSTKAFTGQIAFTGQMV